MIKDGDIVGAEEEESFSPMSAEFSEASEVMQSKSTSRVSAPPRF